MSKSKKKSSGERPYNFFITANNPQDHGWTHEKLIETAKKGATDLVYYVISDEIGLECKTPHTHFFICYKNGKSLEKKRNDFLGCDVRKKYDDSTFSEVREYVLKKGKYEGSAKEDTRVEGTQEEWGTLPRDRKKKASTQQVEQKLEDGEDINKVLTGLGIVRPQMEQGIRNYHMRLRDKEIPMLKDQTVVLHLGDCENYLKNEVSKGLEDFYVVRNYRNPWDTYQGERLLFLDRYKGQLGYGDFLSVIDNLKYTLDARYANKKALWTEVHIITNWSLEDLILEMMKKDNESYLDINEVLEKITSIVYHFKKSNRLSVLEIPAKEFLTTLDLHRQSEAIKNDSSVIVDEIHYSEEESPEEE